MSNKPNINRPLPNILTNWTESELMYFPRSPRVVPDAEVDPLLESSIQQHFATVKADYGVEKLELAKVARIEGLKLIHLLDTGEELSNTDVQELIDQQDKVLQETVRPKVIRRAEDVTGPMVSLSDVNLGSAPPSRSSFLPGLFIVYGGADSNKSHRLKKLYDFTAAKFDGQFNYEYVIVGEPDHRSLGSWRETISILRYGFIDNGATYVPDVMFVDSLKDLLYMPGDSGSGAGGLSTSTIMELSSISSQLMRDGRTVIAVVNPSQPKYMDDMYETLKSNVTGVFYYNPSKTITRDKVEHFTPQSIKPLLSSFRKWSNEYYEREADQQILALVGLEGDILDMATKAAPVSESKRSVLTQTRAVSVAADVKRRMKNFLTGSTPANK